MGKSEGELREDEEKAVADAELYEDAWYAARDDAEREAEMEADFFATGDARRCPRHPWVKTSSDDGMFDSAGCEECMREEADDDEARELGCAVAELRSRRKAAREAELAAAEAARVASTPDPDDILF